MRTGSASAIIQRLLAPRLAFAWNFGPDPVPPTQPMPPLRRSQQIWSRPTSSLDSDIPPPPPPPPSSGSTAAIIIGMLCAVVLVGIVGGAYALAQQGGFLAKGATATVAATTTASVEASPTDSLAPTADPTSAAQGIIPTPGPGYQTYTSSEQGWGCDYPATALVGQGSVTVQGVTVPTTAFDFAPGVNLTVYALPATIDASSAQEIFNELVTAVGATNVTITEQPEPITVGANTWERVTMDATVNGQALTAQIYFAPHGSGALAISGAAPVTQFDDAAAQDFTPLLQSFTLLGA